MTAFWGIARYEYGMAIRRWGVWLAFAGLGVLLTLNALDPTTTQLGLTPLQQAGMLAIRGNLFQPVLAGIVLADRLARDRQLRLRELQWATPVSRRIYILGKYVGVLASILTPTLAIQLVGAAFLVALRQLPLAFVGQALVAFLAIDLPAYAFVCAFSLACPEVLPVRVYQILFTGYWVWGNFLTPRALPTVNGTLLTVKGDFVAGAFFDLGETMLQELHTPVEAVLNLLVLAACAAAALLALERYLAWQARRA